MLRINAGARGTKGNDVIPLCADTRHLHARRADRHACNRKPADTFQPSRCRGQSPWREQLECGGSPKQKPAANAIAAAR